LWFGETSDDAEAMSEAQESQPYDIILYVSLPGISGVEVA
jgi:DNA-binding response OmpR family regulator